MAVNTTVNTIRDRWVEQSDTQWQQNHNSLNYVQALAALTGTNIKRWNVLATFGVGDGSDNLVADPRQLNKRFFDKLANVKVQGLAASDEQQAQLIKALRKQAARTSSQSLRRARNTVAHARSLANNHYQQYMQQLKTAARAQETVVTLEADTSGTTRADQAAQQLADTIAAGFWCDPLMVRSTLWLRTAGNVVMRESNPAANLDLNVDLGRFGVRIDFDDNCITVVPDTDNKLAQEVYYHPHVGANGNICWGDAHEVVNQHLLNCEYGAVLDLLAALLVTYCAEAPYASLATLARAPNLDWRQLDAQRLKRPSTGSDDESEEAPARTATRRYRNIASTADTLITNSTATRQHI